MNAKELYRAIGGIDDDLILAANETEVRKKKHPLRLWAAAAAACLCMILTSVYSNYRGSSIIWNEGYTSFAVKISIPENSTMCPLDMDQFSKYYGISLPDALNGQFVRTDPIVQVFMDSQGDIVYDRNLIRYENSDGTKSVDLTLARVSFMTPVSPDAKLSKIHGTSVALTEDLSIPGTALFSAQWEQDGTEILVSSEGIEKTEFLSIIKTLIR